MSAREINFLSSESALTRSDREVIPDRATDELRYVPPTSSCCQADSSRSFARHPLVVSSLVGAFAPFHFRRSVTIPDPFSKSLAKGNLHKSRDVSPCLLSSSSHRRRTTPSTVPGTSPSHHRNRLGLYDSASSLIGSKSSSRSGLLRRICWIYPPQRRRSRGRRDAAGFDRRPDNPI